jgi:hypothetical protein
MQRSSPEDLSNTTPLEHMSFFTQLEMYSKQHVKKQARFFLGSRELCLIGLRENALTIHGKTPMEIGPEMNGFIE